MKTAIQGEEGSNSATAARALLGADAELAFCRSFRDAFRLLDDGAAARAVLPVENSTAGLVREVWDRLTGIEAGPLLSASAEARVRIAFVAACLPGARQRVRRILAHPVAAAQCGRFLDAARLESLPCHDTAGAARLVRDGGDVELAALCPPGAAAAYGLEIFASECGDSSRTVTRFLLIEPGPARPAIDDDRALLALSLPDRPGALLGVLEAFAQRGLNLCALHSRAIPGRPGTYSFIVEVESGALAPGFADALLALADVGVQLLGSFKAPPWPELPPE